MSSTADRKHYPAQIDESAIHTPDRTYAIIPKSNDLDDGYYDFTYKQLARAIHKMSWWLDHTLGKSVSLDTLGYIGASDLRYTILYVAALKTHRQVLYPSFNNSIQGQLNLVKATKCQALIASEGLTSHWHALGPDLNDIPVILMPSFEEFINDDSVEPYLFTKSWEESKHDPILILHTSGSTGLPKPIRYTSYMLSLMMTNIFANTRSLYLNATVISPMPPSWIVGLLMNVHCPLDFGTIPILLPVDAPLPMSADYIDKVHTTTTTRAKGVFYVPSLLKELSRNKTYVDHMRHLSFVAFGGASLDREVGELFRSFCHLQPTIGSTEVGGYGVKSGENEDWPYFEFNPMTGFQFLPFQDDLYESVVVKHSDAEMASTQMVFFVFPDLDVYHTKDVWREHPTKKGLWTMCGRTDDFVKLSSLTKFNGTHIEEAVLRHPLVKDVVMGGEAREAPFLLVGLVDDDMDRKEALEQIWPVIDEVNGNISPEIRLKKEMVLLTTPGKPMRRVGKGTVNRRLTLQDYADEIDMLYQEKSRNPS